tara:strand:- start:35 stop:1399 length:1365 start_codon:yes stop_codon:yes gene_type:complete
MPSNVVLIIIDSLRSDKFYHHETTSKKPYIDSLIKNGTYFTNAISSADGTILSWSSIFTGNHPFKTGIRSSRFNKLDDKITTVFDHLKNYNYSFYGFLPTFSETINLFPNFKNENYLYDFTETLDTGLGEKILSILPSLSKTQPWFFTIHLMDLHFPLLVPKKFDNDKFGFSKYEKILSSIDHWFEKILTNIDLENTILIITADHGGYVKKIKTKSGIIDFEDDGKKVILKKKFTKKTPKYLKFLKDKIFFSMEEKKRIAKNKILSKYDITESEKRALMLGQFSTEHVLFDDAVHVPLLFVGRNISKEKIFTKQVGLVDLLPTLTYLLNIDFDYSSCDGKNLFPLKSEEIYNEIPAYIESTPLIDMKSNDVIGIRTSNFKYFRDKNYENERVHLYNLLKDPLEENNCALTNKTQVSKMEHILQKILQSQVKTDYNGDDLTSNEIENELRKMGYV